MKNDALSYIIGSREILENMIREGGNPEAPFSDRTMEFLGAWSDIIRELPREKKDTAAAAFGLWCRRSGTAQMKADYPDIMDGYAGRGICLQFVPNNIPALFAYSLAAGLLSGNSVIMRLPSGYDADSPLISALKAALEKCPDFASRIVLIRYPHDAYITDWLSEKCDVRIIWGGDKSIEEIRKSPLKDSAAETVFPNRHSMAVISAGSVIKESDISGLIRGFFNDTYLNDQNACSSPGIIYWLGSQEDILKAKKRFWTELAGFLKGKYNLQAETSVKKLEEGMLLAGSGKADSVVTEAGNSIVRVHAENLTSELWEHMAGGGFFIESEGETLDAFGPLLTPVCQTIACYGDMPVKSFTAGFGSFQVVPVGHTLDFSLVWDRQDLIRNMCRKKD